ncbi:trp region conserved hypothetical membrane protein [Micromonospora pattaloongensis]|uniref:Trp region conserved hypothetical membrane protein n=1 Tax=Micromonospora pattaloongensis TaxID=405436 RepID=A0A1H3Q804_9ACTN|nr:Trp biosynthesis-associated membrane protein [Micromonospora pattaloongensis]SDZ08829.1 trp region conserved hypothetical membrane protein [Micromonospora pattaloongensis]
MTGPATTAVRNRRPLTYAVLLAAVGAGLALFAATRTWAVEVTVRPAPLPSVRTGQSGGALMPWLPPLAVVGLAGAGAVIATRGPARRLVGGLLVLIGVALTLGGGYGAVAVDRGAAGGAALAWPVLGAVGGLLVTAAAVTTVARGRDWPAMGARYERAAGRAGDGGAVAGPAGRVEGTGTTRAWDALDRGEDPTVS